jgi:hypothetical protein
MPEQTVLVWDLETVPDLAAAARMLGMSNATDADIRQALGSGLPPDIGRYGERRKA